MSTSRLISKFAATLVSGSIDLTNRVIGGPGMANGGVGNTNTPGVNKLLVSQSTSSTAWVSQNLVTRIINSFRRFANSPAGFLTKDYVNNTFVPINPIAFPLNRPSANYMNMKVYIQSLRTYLLVSFNIGMYTTANTDINKLIITSINQNPLTFTIDFYNSSNVKIFTMTDTTITSQIASLNIISYHFTNKSLDSVSTTLELLNIFQYN